MTPFEQLLELIPPLNETISQSGRELDWVWERDDKGRPLGGMDIFAYVGRELERIHVMQVILRKVIEALKEINRLTNMGAYDVREEG